MTYANDVDIRPSGARSYGFRAPGHRLRCGGYKRPSHTFENRSAAASAGLRLVDSMSTIFTSFQTAHSGICQPPVTGMYGAS